MSRDPVPPLAPQPGPASGRIDRLRTFAATHVTSLAATAMVAISTVYGLVPPLG